MMMLMITYLFFQDPNKVCKAIGECKKYGDETETDLFLIDLSSIDWDTLSRDQVGFKTSRHDGKVTPSRHCFSLSGLVLTCSDAQNVQ